MKFKELTSMAKEDLGAKKKELELELIKLNTQVATGTPPKDSGRVSKIKKDIARINLIAGIRAATAKSEKPSQKSQSSPTTKSKTKTQKTQ